MTTLPTNNLAAGIDGSPLGRLIRHNDLLFAGGVAMVLATLLIPMPLFIMDMLLAVSIAVSLATLVVVLSAKESLEFSSFPSLLLFVTLFRVAMNVASTRLILTEGAAGDIIHTFGTMVVGSNIVIGLVVFLILVVIQFVVITRGAERISEVAARFNLDAMPGKQMAIDADLNAGLIGEEEARSRRGKIVRESEFYGAMDGASKFIRGDALAGLIIVAVNLIGGIVVGMVKGFGFEKSINTYSILAIGDGLVTQIPAVIIATASGFLISKTSSHTSVSTDLAKQLLQRSRPLYIVGVLFLAMTAVKGFPKVPFLVLGGATIAIARVLRRQEVQAAADAATPPPAAASDDSNNVEELLEVDRLSIQVGARLVKIIDPRRKSSLANRIAPLRKKFAQNMGLVLPLVRLRDNVALEPNTYEIRLYNHVVATGRLEAEKFLAMDGGGVSKPMAGQTAREPVFNLPALWIGAEQKEDAELRGYTVVDPESVLVTHLSETLRRHAHELLSRDDVQKLVDRLKEKNPAVVNGVIGDSVPLGLLHRVLQNLLRDGIAIRDIAQIIEILADNALRTKDINLLSELARKSVVRTITEQHADEKGRILAIVLDPQLEHQLRTSLGEEGFSLPAEQLMDLVRRTADAWRFAMEQGLDKTVMLCDFRIRAQLAAMLIRQIPGLPVLAYDEIAAGTSIQTLRTVNLLPMVDATAQKATSH